MSKEKYSFNDDYYKYFLWNNGLLDYFFSPEKKEILLYVDQLLLEEIGKQVGIEAENYKDDFISCVEGFCTHYNRLICVKRSPNDDKLCGFKDCKYHSNIFCLKNNFRKDVLAVANHIYTKNIKYFDVFEDSEGKKHTRKSEDNKPLSHKLPFFAIVIYAILKFDNGITQKWENVPNISRNSRTFIPELWNLINQHDSRFNKDASIYDRSDSKYGDYVGRILYHLPLSASTRNKLCDAIYKSSAWKLIDTKPFTDIIGLMMSSLKTEKANAELKDVLLNSYIGNDTHGISARKVLSVIEDFDIESYEMKLHERKYNNDYDNTMMVGEFALCLYFPEDNDDTDNSIVLLTTVQQAIECGEYIIKEGRSGTIAGYNTSFVEYNNSIYVELKNYSLINKKENIRVKPLPIEDVIFFYEYDKNLYIQTREIKAAKSYIVAVRKGKESLFDTWCNENQNNFVQWSFDDTRDLFGNDWTIYYTDKIINGQYYPIGKGNAAASDTTNVIMKGGIKKNSNTYFINSLPYFEIPEIYNPKDVKLYINLNGRSLSEEDEYETRILDRKIIIDIIGMPINSNDTAYMDIGVECNSKTNYSYSINVCGQSVVCDSDYIYKFNQYGILDNVDAYSGNNVNKEYRCRKISGLFQINNREDFKGITDALYFTNLLAACCYSNEHSEITHSKFRKCVSYATTRLDIDIQRDGFISNAKSLLCKAGIININYSTNKCQAIVPSFMKVPFSMYQTTGSQLYMLSGCYTRAFIADLYDFCQDKNIQIFTIKNESKEVEDVLLPPIILLGHNFNAEDFCQQHGHQCDIIKDYDFTLSLLNMIPSYKEIASHFSFTKDESYQFLQYLERTKEDIYPRIRSLKAVGGRSVKYIEKQQNVFAKIEDGFLPWASIYCHHEKKSPMVILQKDNSVYIPTSILLPYYVQRALFLMNLGLPEPIKAFVRGAEGDLYYTKMYKYNLHNEDRCNLLADKITGMPISEQNKLVRDRTKTEYKMEFWKAPFRGKKHTDTYLVLLYENNPIAIAYNQIVYIKYEDVFWKLCSPTVNEGMTFLIQTKHWEFKKLKGTEALPTAIGWYSKDQDNIVPVFEISNKENDKMELPSDTSDYIKEPIQIL